MINQTEKNEAQGKESIQIEDQQTGSSKVAGDGLSLSPQEIKLSIAGFIAFFLIMLSYYVLKATRSGIFIAVWGPEYIPVFLILNAIVSFAASALFGYLSDRLKPNRLIASILGFFCLNLLAFWALFKFFSMSESPNSKTLIVSGLYTLWIGFFALFTVTPFWSTVTSIFKASSSKLLFGFIGVGGTIGAMSGSKIVSKLASQIGSENLLLLSAIPLALVIPCIFYMYKTASPECNDNKGKARNNSECLLEDKKTEEADKGALTGLVLISKSPYVMLIGTIVILSTLAISLIDYKVHDLVSTAALGKDQTTAFFADIYFNVTLISIATHIGTPVVLHLFGIKTALSLLPLALLGGSVVIFNSNSLSFLAMAFAVILALHYSISQISKELLYVPCEKAIRYKAKSFIDTFGYRLGPVLSAGVIFIAGRLGSPWLLLAALVVISCLWLSAISKASTKFTTATDKTKND